ncbi:MAG: Lrp/AsnC family transcriptional regulator, partial [Candidatus Micrarchaeaceae archaeon]
MAQELPEPVAKALREIKRKRNTKHAIFVVSTKRNYYVYETTTAKVGDKRKAFNLYLGKIFPNGEFVEAKRRRTQYTYASSIDEMLEKRRMVYGEELANPDPIDLEILTILSGNARAQTKEIAEQLNFSEAAVQHRIERLEQRYGIRYTIEIAPRPFGYFRYIVLVKFNRGAPEIQAAKEALEAAPTVLYAALLKGDYDLFIYMLAENTKLLEDVIYDLRSSHAFAPYEATWYVTYITYGYGYIPLRPAF